MDCTTASRMVTFPLYPLYQFFGSQVPSLKGSSTIMLPGDIFPSSTAGPYAVMGLIEDPG